MSSPGDVPGDGPSLRKLFGFESLHLQGFEKHMCSDPNSLTLFGDHDLQNLAGNAYAVPHVHLACLVALCLFDVPKTSSELDHLRNLARKSQ